MTPEELQKMTEEMGPWWSCQICTYSNPNDFEHCYLCGANKNGEDAMSIFEAAERLGTGIRASYAKEG